MRGSLCEICELEVGTLRSVCHREVGRSHKNTLCVTSYCASQVRGGEGTSNNRLWSHWGYDLTRKFRGSMSLLRLCLDPPLLIMWPWKPNLLPRQSLGQWSPQTIIRHPLVVSHSLSRNRLVGGCESRHNFFSICLPVCSSSLSILTSIQW